MHIHIPIPVHTHTYTYLHMNLHVHWLKHRHRCRHQLVAQWQHFAKEPCKSAKEPCKSSKLISYSICRLCTGGGCQASATSTPWPTLTLFILVSPVGSWKFGVQHQEYSYRFVSQQSLLSPLRKCQHVSIGIKWCPMHLWQICINGEAQVIMSE